VTVKATPLSFVVHVMLPDAVKPGRAVQAPEE
jgi:hypothetical protein